VLWGGTPTLRCRNHARMVTGAHGDILRDSRRSGPARSMVMTMPRHSRASQAVLSRHACPSSRGSYRIDSSYLSATAYPIPTEDSVRRVGRVWKPTEQEAYPSPVVPVNYRLDIFRHFLLCSQGFLLFSVACIKSTLTSGRKFAIDFGWSVRRLVWGSDDVCNGFITLVVCE